MDIASPPVRSQSVYPEAVAAIALAALLMGSTPTLAQNAGQHDEHSGTTVVPAGHEMTAMAREGSGTAWLPDESPAHATHVSRGPWMLMLHENVFLQYVRDQGRRGADQVGSINWIMGMAQRRAGSGRLALVGMFSAEPSTIRGCGYPDLLATGEECRGGKIHDRQHPHDLFMELAAHYDAPVARTLKWQVYAGAAGEPALGPVAYPHRVSAMPNPLAPISHHWLDSTHVTFGVATAGVYAGRWKAEASVFNGREPDEERTDFDFGPMNSVSGRFWWLPTPRLALQVSGGHLQEAEGGEAGGARIDVNRVTASATYHRLSENDNLWATTMAWGRNGEPSRASNAVLVETSLTLKQRDTFFGRFEVAGKSAHDLDVPEPPESFTVAKLQGGYTRYLRSRGGFQPGVGGSASLGVVPAALKSAYGGRLNAGMALFLTLRSAAFPGANAGDAHRPGGGMVMVQTAFDPSKLSCPSPVDDRTAARTTYDGRIYYFCSAADRDRFLTDPAMSLSMMPPRQ